MPGQHPPLSGNTPPTRHSTAPAGREQRGAPPARKTSAPSGLTGPFLGPRRPISPCTSSLVSFPKEDFLGAGRLLRAHRPGQVPLERDEQAMGSDLHQPSRSACSRAPAAPPGNAGRAPESIRTSTSLEKCPLCHPPCAGRGRGLPALQPPSCSPRRGAKPSRGGGISTSFPF